MNLVELNTDTTYFRTDKNSTHSYLPLYDNLLKPIKDTAINILEIGVRHGGSIKLWLDYFTKGTIYGCDIKGEGSERAEKLKLIGKNRVVLKLDEDAYTEQYVLSLIHI